eukprot:11513968-Alexandrium_andersonii.AAC.1
MTSKREGGHFSTALSGKATCPEHTSSRGGDPRRMIREGDLPAQGTRAINVRHARLLIVEKRPAQPGRRNAIWALPLAPTSP